MKEYASDLIRNVAIVSHDGAGKTALVESLLLACGAVASVGKGQDNKHIMDFEPEEIKRNVTIQLGMAPCEWKIIKLISLIPLVILNSMEKYEQLCVQPMVCLWYYRQLLALK